MNHVHLLSIIYTYIVYSLNYNNDMRYSIIRR